MKKDKISLTALMIALNVCGGLILWQIVVLFEKLEFYPNLIEIQTRFGLVYHIVSAVIIAPPIEEFIFRYPIRFIKNPKWYIIISSVIFGLIHITGYEYSNEHLPYIALITSPQILAGFIFAYTRLKLGFWYGVIVHSMSNLVFVFYEMYIGW